jgi:hypothetical protein
LKFVDVVLVFFILWTYFYGIWNVRNQCKPVYNRVSYQPNSCQRLASFDSACSGSYINEKSNRKEARAADAKHEWIVCCFNQKYVDNLEKALDWMNEYHCDQGRHKSRAIVCQTTLIFFNDVNCNRYAQQGRTESKVVINVFGPFKKVIS